MDAGTVLYSDARFTGSLGVSDGQVPCSFDRIGSSQAQYDLSSVRHWIASLRGRGRMLSPPWYQPL